MMLEDLKRIIEYRRSIRAFNDQPVCIEAVKEIVEISSHAASNNNRQGWKFYAVHSRTIIEQIYSAVENILESLNQESRLASEIISSYRKNFTVFRGAPVLLACCCLKPTIFSSKFFSIDEENGHMTGELISMSLVMQNILLVSESMNIGTLVMTAPLIAAKEIKKILNIPARYSIGAFVCMGYYDIRPEPPSHLSIDRIFETI